LVTESSAIPRFEFGWVNNTGAPATEKAGLVAPVKMGEINNVAKHEEAMSKSRIERTRLRLPTFFITAPDGRLERALKPHNSIKNTSKH